MSLDKNPVTLEDALYYAEYYPKDKYAHAMRVMGYVCENSMIPEEYKEDCIMLAIMHDLIEDTDFTGAVLPENTRKALYLLTKPKDMDYITYIQRIKLMSACSPEGKCAWWVKLADMKDHLAQTETLTDRLKEKYLTALPYLL